MSFYNKKFKPDSSARRRGSISLILIDSRFRGNDTGVVDSHKPYQKLTALESLTSRLPSHGEGVMIDLYKKG